MAQRDPFGRLPDENPLAGLGTLSEGTESQVAEPVVAGETAPWKEGRAAKARSTASRPRRAERPVDPAVAEALRRAGAPGTLDPAKVVARVGRVVRLAFGIAVIAAIAIIAGAGTTIFEAGKDIRDGISDLPSPQVLGEDAAEREGEASAPPVGLSSGSLLVQANFARAMRRLRTSGLGRMRSMSVRPERVDAQVLTKEGRLRSVQVPWSGALATFGTSGGGFRDLETIPFARIDSGAPARLARSAAGRSRKPVSQIDYVVLFSFSGKPAWSAFMKGGKQFLADGHGRITSNVN